MAEKKEAPWQNTEKLDDQTLLFLSTLGGTVPRSRLHNWMPMKMMMSTSNTTKRAIIRAPLQAHLEPPFWRANSKHTIAGIKTAVPEGPLEDLFLLR